ncbi:MAG: vanadium-dependent haloperoxidase [Saprospiraceae bacterium]
MADPIAAAASAAYEVLVNALPDQKAMLNERLTASLAPVPDGEAKAQGIALGKKAAAAILALRQNDRAFEDPISPVAPSTEPGVYQAVPPLEFVFAPQWKTMPPFALQKPEQFRVKPHPAINSAAYTTAFNEVKTMGQKDSPQRSATQTQIAKFWYEFSEIGWNRVTRVAVANHKMDLLATARLFALVNMALADSYIAGWDSKFHYNFWRPFTAIRRAENDGNANTAADVQWEPSEVTPPVHDYPSTHSVLGNAAATVLTKLLGDQVAITLESNTALPDFKTRTFTSFYQAADENAESRVLAGIHFRFSCEEGQAMGNTIGKWVVENHLAPLD